MSPTGQICEINDVLNCFYVYRGDVCAFIPTGVSVHTWHFRAFVATCDVNVTCQLLDHSGRTD